MLNTFQFLATEFDIRRAKAQTVKEMDNMLPLPPTVKKVKTKYG